MPKTSKKSNSDSALEANVATKRVRLDRPASNLKRRPVGERVFVESEAFAEVLFRARWWQPNDLQMIRPE